MNTYKRHRFQLGAPHLTSSPRQSGSTIASPFGYKQSQSSRYRRSSSRERHHGQPRSDPPLVPKALAALMGQALYKIRRHLLPPIARTRRVKRKHRGFGDTFYLDEVFVRINGKQHYLWRAVDQDGEVVDVYLQAKRDGAAATRFFKRLLRSHGGEPRKIVTDKLRSYGVAHRELIPETIHSTEQYENNRAEQSHEVTRVRERVMRRFKSVGQAQRFLGAHAAVSNLFNLGRHLVRAQHYRNLRESAFADWSRAVA